MDKQRNDINDIKEGFKAFSEAIKIDCNHNANFKHKFEKHFNDPRKLAIYLCERYSSQDPDDYVSVFRDERKPDIEAIKNDELAMQYVERIKSFGWRIKVGEWPNLGKQLIVIKDDGKCFHSEYRW